MHLRWRFAAKAFTFHCPKAAGRTPHLALFGPNPLGPSANTHHQPWSTRLSLRAQRAETRRLCAMEQRERGGRSEALVHPPSNPRLRTPPTPPAAAAPWSGTNTRLGQESWTGDLQDGQAHSDPCKWSRGSSDSAQGR